MTRAPSIKSLQKTFKGLSVDDAKRIREILHRHNGTTAQAATLMVECDDILKGYTYGVEHVTKQVRGMPFDRITHFYLNTGDTYKGTIFYSVKSGNFYITDLGTVVGG